MFLLLRRFFRQILYMKQFWRGNLLKFLFSKQHGKDGIYLSFNSLAAFLKYFCCVSIFFQFSRVFGRFPISKALENLFFSGPIYESFLKVFFFFFVCFIRFLNLICKNFGGFFFVFSSSRYNLSFLKDFLLLP